MLALDEGADVVIGVDTHKDTHTAAAVSPTGAVLEHLTAPANPDGLSPTRRLRPSSWGGAVGHRGNGELRGRAHGRPALAGGASGRGRPPAASCSTGGSQERRHRRRPSGPPGARRRRSRRARCRGDREAIRVLLSTRAQAVDFRTRAIAALHTLITSAPDSLRERLRSCRWAPCCEPAPDSGARRARRRGVRHGHGASGHRSASSSRVSRRRRSSRPSSDVLVRRMAPVLLDQVGIGSVVAAQILVSWSHRSRAAPRQHSPSSEAWLPSRRPQAW